MDFKHHIGPKIRALSVAMNQEMNRNTAALDLTASQAFLLGYLIHQQHRPVYPKDLEQEFDLTHPTVSGILRRLEQKGFVSFQPSETDKRCKRILITEKAVSCHTVMIRQMYETERKAITGISESELKELHRLLDIIMENIGATPCCGPHNKQEDLT